MDSDKDHIKDIFSSKLKKIEPTLPVFGWEKIDADLSKKSVLKITSIRKKIYQISASVAAVAAILLLAFFLMPEFQGDDNFNPNVVALSDRVSIEKEDTLVSAIGQDQILRTQSLPELVSAKIKSKKDSFSLDSNPPLETPDVESDPTGIIIEDVVPELDEQYSTLLEPWQEPCPLVAENVLIKEPSDKETQKNKSFEKELGQRIAEFESKGNELNDLLSYADEKQASESRGLQLGLEGGSGFSKSNDTKNQLNTMHQGSPIALRSSKVKLKHNQPITFGLGITKRINSKLSLETGINYAYISSKIKNEDDRVVKQKDAQYFHYFGIPLTLSYTFSEWKNFRFYSSFGVMLQKDLYGRIRSNLYSGLINVDEKDTKKISQKNPQFSTTVMLGVSYPVYDKLRVYTNFGGSYYFDAKNEYETIYSDKKWLF